MSCILELIASLSNIVEVLQWFQLKKESNDEDWTTDWGDWKTESDSSASHNNSEKESYWLKNCVVAASPAGDLLSLACKDRIVIFSDNGRYSDDGNRPIFSIIWKSSIGHTERDKIESLLCLPIISQKQSSSGVPDWTCVIVGFSSGYISFYTENGLLLFSQIFEESPVMTISCRTFTQRTLGFGYSVDLSEELVILYSNCIVTIDGFSLLQVLKSCRNQAAKAAASGGEFTNVPSLGYKKWSLSEQEKISDCVSAGVLPPIMYDSLAYLSSTKGFHNTASSGIPQASYFVTSGLQPFAGVLVAKDIGIQPFVSDIALHYASKLKSALFSAATGWLSRDHGAKNKPKVKIETAQPISFRHTVIDRKRVGLSIKICSGRRYAAITDDFGRISLLDVFNGTIIRMWKGYRDAECGWIDITGEWNSKSRTVPFLIIYAPRRGILEIWLPQQGPRIAAFNVSKDSKLLYMPHTLLGSNTIQKIPCRIVPVVLLNPDGTIETLNIPFHLALSGKTSRQARDVHILKTLKWYLKEESEERTLELLREISTFRIKLQAFNLFKSFRYLTPSLSRGMLRILRTPGDDKGSPNSGDHESRLLEHNLDYANQLLNLYDSLSSLHNKVPTNSQKENDCYSKIAKYLILSEDETKSLFTPTYIRHFEPVKKSVKFDADCGLSLSSYLNCWEIQSEASLTANTIHLKLVKGIDEEVQRQLGTFLFGWPYSPQNVDSFAQALFHSGINARELVSVLLSYWLDQDGHTCPSLMHFYSLVLILCVFSRSLIEDDNYSTQTFWNSIRRELLKWRNPHCAFLAAVVCRGVEGAVFVYSQNPDEAVDSDKEATALLESCQSLFHSLENCTKSASLTEWEGLSLEMVEWNLILKRFELLLPVGRLFKIFALREVEKGELEDDLSLKSFLDKGKGFLSELLSKWIIQSGCDLQLVSTLLSKQAKANPKIDQHEIDGCEPGEVDYIRYTNNDDINKASTWEELLEVGMDEVASCFRCSFTPDVIFVNLAWEFGALWNRRPNEPSNLESSIKAIDLISNPFHKHGLSMMLWETLLADRIQNLSLFVEKYSQLPKDRFSLKETGIPEFSLKAFFEHCSRILIHILESNILCEVQHPPIKECDSFWKEHETSPPLADLCVIQKMSCYDIVHLHYQLLTSLYFIANFSIRKYRPLQLFSERERLTFFKPLSTSWTFGSSDSREAVSGKQHNFLCRVIDSAIVALPDISLDDQLIQSVPKDVKEVLELGRNWGVSVDSLRRHYICNLYNSGLDKMAEQSLAMVRDGLTLGSQMIIIAGQRLQYMVSQSPLGAARILALTSPYITDWIKNLESKSLRCPSAPVKSTISMVIRALKYLPESSYEYQTGTYLLTSLKAIDESQQ